MSAMPMYALLLCAGTALAAEKLPHRAVKRVTTGSERVHRRFNPLLFIENGCEPFAAVDDEGNWNGGLRDAGYADGMCTDSTTGQAYARSACRGEYCAHMYCYYFPKDNGLPFPSIGHRHDIEEVVVWTRNDTVVGAAYSAHGDYGYHTEPAMVGDRVNPAYGFSGVTHSFKGIDSDDVGKGRTWPVASYQHMTQAARDTMNFPERFGVAKFALRDDAFVEKVNQARKGNIPVEFEEEDVVQQ